LQSEDNSFVSGRRSRLMFTRARPHANIAAKRY
jgi:hypothetical protein